MKLILFILFYFTLEFYAYQAVKTVFPFDSLKGKIITFAFFSLTAFLLLMLVASLSLGYENIPKIMKKIAGLVFFMGLLAKLFACFWLFGEDIYRFLSFGIAKAFGTKENVELSGRRKFISQIAIFSAFMPLMVLTYGIVRNAYNYKFHQVKLSFKNLPDAFKGFKIVQLSDIHAGTFNQKEPVQKAIDKINALEPDLIVFTGDLVNDLASEMDEYKAIFSQLKAKHGVYSVLGNHDYGDYAFGPNDSPEKSANFEAFLQVHKDMGWDLLRNENRIIEKGGDSFALIGVENISADGRFSNHGDLTKAYRGIEKESFKLLMSHDPSHWDAEVNTQFKDIDLTLSGHTHGFQFGIETKWLKWSPSQYPYKQWAGVYQKAAQYIYVNRGFGNLGYPGRVGILPEVTVIELT